MLQRNVRSDESGFVSPLLIYIKNETRGESMWQFN